MTRLYLSRLRFAILLLFCATSMAWAQQVVTGRILSGDDNSSVPGVNVLEKGTSNGTVSDADGNFRISVGSNATLVFSFVGYTTQEVVVGSQSIVNVTMAADITSLSEVVVIGYGSQDKKEITSSVVQLSEKDFNKGTVNDPTQLLQGKVPGLSIYNRGGDPNAAPEVRLRGISTVGANTEPLIVIDGVIGASLDNVDPADIESYNVLKDGSAAAIYGSRGSSGVILVQTKRGSKKGIQTTYGASVAIANVLRSQNVMSAGEYVAAGGNDLGSVTDWQDEVTRTGITGVHNIAISGANDNTSFRVSTNIRNVNGILQKSGFDQLNTRAAVTHKALDGKLNVDMSIALTNRNVDLSFNEALRYAALYNPTAPVTFPNGNYFQAILFDNFNPVAILEQNTSTGKRKTMNFAARASYELVKGLTATVNVGRQYSNFWRSEYYSMNSLFRGLNRGGLARRAAGDNNFTLAEAYGTYSGSWDKVTLDVSGGYSFQQENDEFFFVEVGNFPSDALGVNALETAGDRISGIASNVNITSNASPDVRIAAVFGRFNFSFDNAIFVNGSIRREGSTKLGENNRFGVFPALGLGVDLNHYLQIGSVDVLKLRVGYGVTGSLPRESGLAQDLYAYSFNGGGNVTKTRDANLDLKWEQKAEINAGIDFGLGGKVTGSLDVYTRNIKDFILERNVDVTIFPSGRRFENAGSLKTNGIEFAAKYTSLNLGQAKWTPGIVLSSYQTTLESFIIDQQMRADLGAPGQNGTNMVRVAVGEKIGQIWGPVFTGVNESNGTPVFADLNGDGTVVSAQGSALLPTGDFKELGHGLPTLEAGWTNDAKFGNWELNFFFRGAFGHSLVNSFRAFYEPIDPGAINSYNRFKSDKSVAGLTTAQFSSLYVEKANFVKLDNITLTYNVPTTGTIKNLKLFASVQNAFVISKYTGIDPEPALQDLGAIDNGGYLNTNADGSLRQPDVLSPGIDRRNNYFTARTMTFGLNIGF